MASSQTSNDENRAPTESSGHDVEKGGFDAVEQVDTRMTTDEPFHFTVGKWLALSVSQLVFSPCP
jgi:hypothetical protein